MLGLENNGYGKIFETEKKQSSPLPPDAPQPPGIQNGLARLARQALVRQALDHAGVFVFGELLECANVQAEDGKLCFVSKQYLGMGQNETTRGQVSVLGSICQRFILATYF